MWVPKTTFELFHISKGTVDALREELSAVRQERDDLREELIRSQILSDWLRTQVNSLQFERTALLQKAYGITVPVPQLQQAPKIDPMSAAFSFDDPGDEIAQKFGYSTSGPPLIPIS